MANRLTYKQYAMASAYIGANWGRLESMPPHRIRAEIAKELKFKLTKINLTNLLKNLELAPHDEPAPQNGSAPRPRALKEFLPACRAMLADYPSLCEELGREVPETIRKAIEELQEEVN